MQKQALEKLVVPLAMPLTAEEHIDVAALERCVQHVINGGVQAIFVNSTTGEYLALTDAMRREAIQRTHAFVGNRAALFIGISDIATERVLQNLEFAARFEPRAFVLLPPLFYPASSAALIRFFERIADAAPAPIVLYNNPKVIRNELDFDTVKRLLEHPNIVGIKDSSGDYRAMLKLISLKRQRPDFSVYASKAYLWSAGLHAGADGMIDAMLNVIPAWGARLLRLLETDQQDRARVLQQRVMDVLHILDIAPPIPAIKAALHLMGLCEPYVTHPFRQPDAATVNAIRHILETHNVI